MAYYTKGGVTLEESQKMKRKKFIWFLKRLSKQKTDENNAIKKANSMPMNSQPKGKMKYLGNKK